MELDARYSVIDKKNPREIVLLRGSGCRYRRCTFCDYHLDFSRDQEANDRLNGEVLSKVRGIFGKLEVINSGSFCDLSPTTLEAIRETAREKGIHEIHFESHWMHREEIPVLRAFFKEAGITVKMKIGVETFNADYRERILCKGIDETDPAGIAAAGFDEVCLLQGLTGQTSHSMNEDIETGLAHFERVCVNIMNENSTSIKPDASVIDTFLRRVYPRYFTDPRVDLLIDNLAFGVGTKVQETEQRSTETHDE